MFKGEDVEDYMADVAETFAVGAVDKARRGPVWTALRDLVGDMSQAADADELDWLMELNPPKKGKGPHTAIVVADHWNEIGCICVVPDDELDAALRADLEAVNGKTYDDQRDDTDWATYTAALRVAAACGLGGSFEELSKAHEPEQPGSREEMGGYAGERFGVFSKYSVDGKKGLRRRAMEQPLSSCYGYVFGGSAAEDGLEESGLEESGLEESGDED